MTVVLILSMLLVVKHGINPKPHRLIDASAFSSTQSIGAVVYRRLFKQWQTHPAVFLSSASSAEANGEVWLGLLKTALAEDVPFKMIVVDEALASLPLPEALRGRVWNDFSRSTMDLARQALQQQHRVLFVVSADRSESDEWRAQLPFPSILISQTVFEFEDKSKYRQQCADGDMVSCSKNRIIAKAEKKKLSPDKWVVALERVGRSDFVLFLNSHKKELKE